MYQIGLLRVKSLGTKLSQGIYLKQELAGLSIALLMIWQGHSRHTLDWHIIPLLPGDLGRLSLLADQGRLRALVNLDIFGNWREKNPDLEHQ